MPSEIWYRAVAVYEERYRSAVPSELRLWFRDYLHTGKNSLKKEAMSKSSYADGDHIKHLFSMAETAENISVLAHRFAKERILRPAGDPEGQLSASEWHRIYRAFWRFQEIFEKRCANDDDGGRKGSSGGKRYVSGRTWPNLREDPGETWLKRSVPSTPSWWLHDVRMLEWEVGEIEAVKEHLRCEVNNVQIGRYQRSSGPDHLSCPILIQNLIKSVENWPTDAGGLSKDHALVAELIPIWSHEGPLFDPTVTHLSSHESRFMENRQKSLDIHEEWGWRMFDRERLVFCGLLPNELPNIRNIQSEVELELELFEEVNLSHRVIYDRLKDGQGLRIQAQFDADVDLNQQLLVQSAELKRSESLMEWVKPRDPALFEQWYALLQAENFDGPKQLEADLCHKKGLIMQSLEQGSCRSGGQKSEEQDLELLVLMRERK